MDNFIKLLRSKTKYQLDYWDPDKFNWGSSWVLAEHCSQHFDIWWDPDRFNWRDSWTLAKYCSEYFNTWWDPSKYNWQSSWTLVEYCSEYFNTWWDPNKFDWRDSETLAIFCSKYFNTWWDPNKFNWESSWALAEACSDYFNIWWDPDRFNYNFIDSINQIGINYLFSNCLEYFDTWFPAIVERKDSLDDEVREIVSYVDLALNRPTNESVSQKIRENTSL